MIESLSLIDAVMPDVVETRKQAVSKTTQIKTEATSANGEETSTVGKEFIMVLVVFFSLFIGGKRRKKAEPFYLTCKNF